jgi:hypothetical protein
MPRDEVGASIDATEAAQRLKWLEEERQRDKALLAELQKRQDQSDRQLVHTEEAIERLDERLVRSDEQLARSARFEKALQQFKDEILLQLHRSEERLDKDGEARDRRIGEERQTRAVSLAKLEQRIDEAFKLQETLESQRIEIQRLVKSVSTLQPQIDEAVRGTKGHQETLLALREQVGKCEKTIAEVSQNSDEEAVRSETISESVRLVQARVERETERTAELQTLVEGLRQEQSQLVEGLRKVDDRGKKQISGWTKEMGLWRQEAESAREQVALGAKQIRNGEKVLAALDELKIQLEKDRDSLQHMERTAEERQRQQLEEWRKENELLWLRNEERWAQLAEENAKRDDHIATLWETRLVHLRREVTELEKLIKNLEKRLLRPNR